MKPLAPPPPRAAARATLVALFAAVAGVAGGPAHAQSIDLPARPGYNPPRPPSPPPPPPHPAAPAASAAALEPQQRVEVQGVAPPTAARVAPRTGAYSVKYESERVITVRCLEGGTVVVFKSSFEDMTGPQATRRDTALRQGCRDIDLTK